MHETYYQEQHPQNCTFRCICNPIFLLELRSIYPHYKHIKIQRKSSTFVSNAPCTMYWIHIVIKNQKDLSRFVNRTINHVNLTVQNINANYTQAIFHVRMSFSTRNVSQNRLLTLYRGFRQTIQMRKQNQLASPQLKNQNVSKKLTSWVVTGKNKSVRNRCLLLYHILLFLQSVGAT